MTIFLNILVLALCIVGAAFFSGIETGVISVHRLRLLHFVKQGWRPARILQRFLDEPDRLLGTTLVGTNICVVVTSVITANLAAHSLGTWGQLASSFEVSAFMLIFCEYLPKAWFHSKPFERSTGLAVVLLASERFLRPCSLAIVWLSRLLVPGPSRSFSKSDPFVTRDELKLLVRQGETEGVISSKERAMIHRVFELSARSAQEIMVPRDRIAFVYHDATIPEFMTTARTTRFTRMPVLDRNTNRFVGIINVFYVVSAAPEKRGETVAGFTRPPLFIPESMPADDVLPKLRRSRQAMCLVTNSQSEVTGLLTTEDILKAIVGAL